MSGKYCPLCRTSVSFEQKYCTRCGLNLNPIIVPNDNSITRDTTIETKSEVDTVQPDIKKRHEEAKKRYLENEKKRALIRENMKQRDPDQWNKRHSLLAEKCYSNMKSTAEQPRKEKQLKLEKDNLNGLRGEINMGFRDKLRDAISRLQYTSDNSFLKKNNIICQCSSINETVEKAAPAIELINALTKQKFGGTFPEQIRFIPDMSGLKVTVVVPGEGEPGVWIFKLRISGGEYIITT